MYNSSQEIPCNEIIHNKKCDSYQTFLLKKTLVKGDKREHISPASLVIYY